MIPASQANDGECCQEVNITQIRKHLLTIVMNKERKDFDVGADAR